MSEQLSTVELLSLEQSAANAISIVRSIVQVLKDEFPRLPTNSGSKIPLFSRMREKGILDAVRSLCEPPRHEERVQSEPEQLASEILLPLMHKLTTMYRVLDNLQAPKPETSKRRGRSKPRPPPGMLSLQDYTDVACLLEFLVCTVLLPVVVPIATLQDRVRHKLPKSLAGRISKDALLWGSSSFVSEPELVAQTCEHLAQLVLLDRFRPMLLPRHAVDLYQGILWVEYVSSKGSRKVDGKYYRALGLVSQQSCDEEPQVMDPTIRAMAYQKILSLKEGTPWLRKRISEELTQMALDLKGLAAILTIFVPVASSSTDPTSLMSGASKRLGRTLAMTQGKSEALWKNLFQLLPRAYPIVEDRSFSIPPRSMAIIQTTWAFLEHLPPSTIDRCIDKIWVKPWFERARDGVRGSLLALGALCAFLPPHSKKAISILSRMVCAGHEDASVLGQLIRIAMVESESAKDAEWTLLWLLPVVLGEDELLEACVMALGSNAWEQKGNVFTVDSNDIQIQQTISAEDDLLHIVAESMEQTTLRSKWFVKNILLARQGRDQKTVHGLPSRFFRFLLQKYLSFDASSRFVVPILLPILCEECPQEQLLFGDTSDEASGLWMLIRQVLAESAKDRTVDDEDLHDVGQSILSILLSMLIALLELGSKSRSPKEEELLQSFLPILNVLASKEPATKEAESLHEAAAMADMAAYAMALIAARKQATVVDQSPSAILSKQERLRKILQEAEADLRSTQPPIRARGIVSLGRLARGFSNSLAKEQKAPALVVEWKEEKADDDDDDDAFFWTGEVLRLSIGALLDEESYVYLAAVQTIVAVGDLYSREVLPILALTIVSGEFAAPNQTTTTILSQEQVIKLTEALVFIIRRRAVTDEHVPVLMNLMLHGSNPEKPTTTHEWNPIEIQHATDRYFAQGANEDVVTKEQEWEERDIRLKTGGPLFAVEEAEVVRSLRISIVSELLGASSSTTLAPFVGTLVRLVVEALNLDAESRAVTRSAALLARELYNRILLESRELSKALAGGELMDGSKFVGIPCAVALLASGQEDVLNVALEKGSNDGVINHTTGISDTSLVARCKEALDLRKEAEEQGIFVAAKLVLAEEEEFDQLPRILRGITTENTPSQAFRLDPIETLE